MNILISTDSSCITKCDVFKNYNINVFPLNVIIDGQEFLDGITIDQNKLRDEMRANKNIKTSTPPLGQIIEYFENLFKKGYEHIIHFTISSKLSSMYDLFCNVTNQHFEGKVTIIDSYALSSVMLSHVFYAYEEVNKGTSVGQIVNNIEERKKHTNIFFVPENLTALKNGGRISPTIALIGNAIGIKPVISLKDGELVKEEMTRKIRRTFEDRTVELIKHYPAEEYDYCIISFDVVEEKLKQIYDLVQAVLGENKIVESIIPINVGAHCGPGTIGLVISPKINGKSLNEF